VGKHRSNCSNCRDHVTQSKSGKGDPGEGSVFGQEPHLRTSTECQLQIKRVAADGFTPQILPSDPRYHSAAHGSSPLETAMQKFS